MFFQSWFLSLSKIHYGFIHIVQNIASLLRGFSDGSVIKNPPANAGDTSLIPNATEELSLCSTTTTPVLQSPGATTPETYMPESPCSTTRETAARRSQHPTTRGYPRDIQPKSMQQWISITAKNKINTFLKDSVYVKKKNCCF